MKAMILAAGFGSRLKPWTDCHPKALVPVGGVPMLERVICNLRDQGFDYIVVNVHHFADQIIRFLESRNFGVMIAVSDESNRLLDTGGAILKASDLLRLDEGPALVHNVDILSNADLGELMRVHCCCGSDSTLLVSDRNSSRKLVFDKDMRLRGWHHLLEDRFLPSGFRSIPGDSEYAFSGIHVVGKKMVERMASFTEDGKFPIMEFLLNGHHACDIRGILQPGLDLIDIGKPATLSQAQQMF